MHARQDEQEKIRDLYRKGWRLAIPATLVILVVIVIVAAIDGFRLAAREQTLKALEANIPARSQVFPSPIPASPTVITAPQSTRTELAAESALVRPTIVAAPEPDVQGLTATVNTQTEPLVLRSGPGTQYARVADLVPGDQVTLLSKAIETDGLQWQLVKTSGGHVGWCKVGWLSPNNGGK